MKRHAKKRQEIQNLLPDLWDMLLSHDKIPVPARQPKIARSHGF